MQNSKLFLLIFILTLILITRFLFIASHARIYHAGDSIALSTLLLSDIDTYSKNSSLTMILPDSFPPQRVNIIVPAGSAIHYGQQLSISGTIKSKVLDNKNAVISMYSPKVSILPALTDRLFSPLYSLRKGIAQGYQITLSDIDSALLLGIVFGIKENMPTSFSQELQATGVTHVIAASGMNVTMVAGFLIAMFSRFFKRKIAISFSLLGLCIYAVFSGLQASILRATIMGICLFSSQLFGKQYKGWYIVLLTGWIMVFFSPSLLFDIGFQLSFLSTLGIIFIQPLFTDINLFTEDLATTISAQLATVPIMVMSFGQYSMLSILVNGLVLWTVPPLMMLGSLAAFVGLFIPSFEKIILFCAMPFLWFFETIISFFASLPILLKFSTNSIFLIAGYYLVVIAIVLVMYRKVEC